MGKVNLMLLSSIISLIPRIGLAICLVWGCISCEPTTIDHQGHRIFNPNYLFYLETERRDKWQKPAEVLKAWKFQTPLLLPI
jgi:hypothetical protein